MKLNEEITLKIPKYTDDKGKLIEPKPLKLSLLEITYLNNPTKHQYSASIYGIPIQIGLWFNDDYIKNECHLKNSVDAENRLKELMKDDPQSFLQRLFPMTLEENPNGPGSILSGMISAIGIKSTPNCSCRKHALEMNEKGPDWCEQNIDTILGWLKVESQKRNLPFVESVARLMVNRAISKSKRLLERDK
jgi:hypothetical protein